MTLSSALAQKFAAMSAERDKPAASETTSRGYQSEEGYVHEVVSKSPTVLRRNSSEALQTVTTRTTVIKGDPEMRRGTTDDGTTSWRSDSAASGSNGSAMQKEYPPRGRDRNIISGTVKADLASQQLPPPTSSMPRSIASPTGPKRTFSPATKPPAEWVQSHRTEERYEPTNRSVPRREQSTQRNVTIGGFDTRMIEPSRVSPLQVDGDYAPVRYITKRELRRLREKHLSAVSNRIRASSVPRLDAMAEERQTGRQFAPYGSEGAVRNPSSERQRSTERGRYRVPSHSRAYAYPNVIPSPQRGGEYDDEDSLPADSTPPRPAYNTNEYLEQQSSEQGGYYQEPRARSVNSDGWSGSVPRGYGVRPPVVTVNDLKASSNGMMLSVIADLVAFARQTPTPPPPPQAVEAFLLLNRGTSLIKYGRQGHPHERYFTLRLVPDERTGRPHPYLLWATHDEAASFKEKLHLSHLVDVKEGPASQNFRRHMISEDLIIGPTIKGRKSQLPTTYAFSLIFRTLTNARTVDCLALDPQTHGCWILVASYLASINSAASETVPVDAEPMQPDTPRSMSSAAFSAQPSQ